MNPPLPNLRVLFLAAKCCELTAAVIDQQAQLTAHETRASSDAAKIAALLRRNQHLTAALHRTACVG